LPGAADDGVPAALVTPARRPHLKLAIFRFFLCETASFFKKLPIILLNLPKSGHDALKIRKLFTKTNHFEGFFGQKG